MTDQDRALRVTTITIADGERIPLAFGARFRVAYGRDGEKVLHDAELVDRKANGDLVFRDPHDYANTARVRPSTITFLAGSGVEVDLSDPTPDDGESAGAFLSRVERELGARYARWAETDAGQAALVAAAREVDQARKATRKAPKTPRPFFPKDALEDALAAAVRDADALASELGHDPDRVAAAVVELHPELAAKPKRPKLVVVGHDDSGLPPEARRDAKPKRSAKPYADRNQVWRCGSCKRRTRTPFCETGHDRVDAPAGKRREDRVG